jgi:CRISPR-associated Csx2 family protein
MSSKPTPYRREGRDQIVLAPLAPLALLQLLPENARPTRVLALCTTAAKEKTGRIFAEGVRTHLGIEPELLDIPNGQSEEEVRQIVDIAAAEFSERDELTLDVTQGFRHFPFIIYALALYLLSLRSIRLRGAYYGMVEGIPAGQPCPIIDLKPLLELPEWFHAVRVFRETGSTGSLAALVNSLEQGLRAEARSAGNVRELHENASKAEKMRDRLDQVAFAYESAMPMEFRKAATLLCTSLKELPTAVSSRLPLSEQLVDGVASALASFKFKESPSWRGEWKAGLCCDQAELTRQAKLIEQYFSRNQFPLAIGLLREWVVSWVLQRQENSARWWSRDERIRAERQLGALSAALASDLKNTLSDEQRSWAEFWQNLSEVRNTLHHHGMRKQALESAPRTVKQLRHFWSRLKENEIALPTLGGGRGTLLITAIGNRPGVLYSALAVARPEQALVLCSVQSRPTIDEAIQQAEFTGPIQRVTVNDPHGGFDELPRIRSEAGDCLLHADEIVANLTGGTTLMGLMVQQLVETGGRLSRPFRRFALIDRRPPSAQDTEPWVRSDDCWIDDLRGENDADN